jgi:hypothetical protein
MGLLRRPPKQLCGQLGAHFINKMVKFEVNTKFYLHLALGLSLFLTFFFLYSFKVFGDFEFSLVQFSINVNFKKWSFWHLTKIQ